MTSSSTAKHASPSPNRRPHAAEDEAIDAPTSPTNAKTPSAAAAASSSPSASDQLQRSANGDPVKPGANSPISASKDDNDGGNAEKKAKRERTPSPAKKLAPADEDESAAGTAATKSPPRKKPSVRSPIRNFLADDFL